MGTLSQDLPAGGASPAVGVLALADCPASECGAKGVALRDLVAAGLPVPDTWVLPAAAIAAWAPEPSIGQGGVAGLWRAAPAWVTAVSHRRPVLVDAPVAGRWAVRSSASCEDGLEASFAGRFHSELADAADLPAAVARVVASLWSDRALAAMRRAELDPRQVRMAVLLQPWIAGEISGVLMTRDPNAEARDCLALSAVAGDCRGCVDGSAPARVLRVDRADGAVETLADDGPEVPAALLRELLRQAQAAERHAGLPLDIEWTWDGERLWLLQARPLTAWRDLTWAPAADCPLHEPGPWRRIGNEPYSPLAAEVALRQGRGRRRGALEAAMRWDCVADAVIEQGWHYVRRIAVGEDERRDRQAAWQARLQRDGERGLSQYDDVAVPLLKDLEERIALLAARGADPRALAERLDLGLVYAEESARLHWVALGGSGLGDRFRRRCRAIDPSIADWQIDRLLVVDGHFAAESALLRRMAACIAAHPALRAACEASPVDELVYARWQVLPDFAELAPLFEHYRHRFGLLCAGNYAFGPRLAPTIGEVPWQLLPRIRPLIGRDHAAALAQRQVERERAEALRGALMQGLDETERAAFLRELAAAQSDAAMRNDHSFLMDQRYRSHLRQAMLDAGRLLVACGLLATVDDAEFCTVDQLRAALLDGLDLGATAAAARTALRRQRRLRAPLLIGEEPAPPLSRPRATEPGRGPWQGRGGGPGTAVGPLVLGIPAQLERPSIIAIPGRTGDYTHLVDRVLGVLCEVGNPFDHTGVIAREYGIPIIYQLGAAFGELPVGAAIAMDGESGVLRLES